MPFYNKAAQVTLILLGILVIFLILAGIVIIVVSLGRGINANLFLAILGAMGSVATLWTVVIVPLYQRLLRKIRQDK